MTPLATLILATWVISATAAATITGRRKGRGGLGFAAGLILGWVGVAIIAFTRPTHDALVQREKQRIEVQREARGA